MESEQGNRENPDEELMKSESNDQNQKTLQGGGQTLSSRSYECTFCKRGFSNAQALGGHMNIHRKDKAKLKQLAAASSNQLYHEPQQQSLPLEIFPKMVPSFSSPNLPINLSLEANSINDDHDHDHNQHYKPINCDHHGLMTKRRSWPWLFDLDKQPGNIININDHAAGAGTVAGDDQNCGSADEEAKIKRQLPLFVVPDHDDHHHHQSNKDHDQAAAGDYCSDRSISLSVLEAEKSDHEILRGLSPAAAAAGHGHGHSSSDSDLLDLELRLGPEPRDSSSTSNMATRKFF